MKYGVIYADPPWAFRTYTGKNTIAHRTATDHYPTMTWDEIAAVPVPDLAAKDCALFLWVVDSHLDVAIDLIRHWGFAYKTRAFDWVKTTKAGKPRMGMGYWTRKGSEECLLATRGKPKRLSMGVRQVFMGQRREHSRKPDEFYGRIEELVGGPYMELFARQRWPGWDSWGSETDKFEAAA